MVQLERSYLKGLRRRRHASSSGEFKDRHRRLARFDGVSMDDVRDRDHWRPRSGKKMEDKTTNIAERQRTKIVGAIALPVLVTIFALLFKKCGL